MEEKKKRKVFVGVSGGVDSSVSLALLKEQGYDVTGVFIRTWQPDFIECTWRDERRDAMRVCAELRVPFLECDLEQAYKDKVAMYMIEEYRKGRTPNPDVMCNKEVKFGGFLDFAIKHGADYIATGHYAQRIDNVNGTPELCMGHDTNKDQSYFLWTLTHEQLSKTLFPVGHLEKSEVRKLAEKYNLSTATKKDSQGVCFLGMIDMKDFLAHYIEKKEGIVLDENGNAIGIHQGVLFYTLGERHGFTITQKGTLDKPYYIIKKDVQNNTMTVTQQNQLVDSMLDTDMPILVSQTIWRTPIDASKKYMARVRYRQTLKECTVEILENNQARIIFSEPQTIASSGQSIVVYDGTACIGGGIID